MRLLRLPPDACSNALSLSNLLRASRSLIKTGFSFWGLGGSWASLGALLESLGALLEALGPLLEALGALLEPSWPSCRPLHRFLEHFGASLEAWDPQNL